MVFMQRGKTMRVAYLMRVDALEKPGGDLVQIQKTIAAGLAGGEDGNPLYTGEILTSLHPDLSGFDLAHLTNIDRPVDTHCQFLAARAAGKPIVLSTIHHSYEEIGCYERLGRGGVVGSLSGSVGFRGMESARSLARAANHAQLLWPTLRVMLAGMLSAQRAVLQGADALLVLTAKEQRDILRDFGPLDAARFERVGNGIEPFSLEDGAERARDVDVCVVGRIEARKNQIAILRALERLGVSGMFAGRENPNHKAYCNEFKRLIGGSASTYLGGLSQADTQSLMRRSRVHVSASWFEVSSLVDIEAHVAGCSVVSSKCGGTHEILGERALYVDPGSPQDIEQAVSLALERSKSGAASDQDEESFVLESWISAAKRLARIYRRLLDRA